MDTKTARERLAAATAKEPQCTCPSRPHFGHGAECLWSRWVHTSMPAKIDIEKQAPATLATLILAVEALEKVTKATAPGDWVFMPAPWVQEVREALDTWKAL